MKKIIAIVMVIALAISMISAVACSRKSDDFKMRDLVYVSENFDSRYSDLQIQLNSELGPEEGGWYTIEKDKYSDHIWVTHYTDFGWEKLNRDGYYR